MAAEVMHENPATVIRGVITGEQLLLQ